MTNIWFTGDTHFGHKNIIRYCKRPFENIEEHDQTLIDNWNALVKPGDKVYHLGDFGFGSQDFLTKTAAALSGQKYLIRGNHDRAFRKVDKTEHFLWVKDLFELKVPDEEMDHKQSITLCHYAFEVWNKRHFGSFHLHGHSHGTLQSSDHQARLDVGVDVHDYKPISYEEVKYHMTRKIFKPIDHHGKSK